MDSRIRLSYHSRLFIMLLGFSWALVACFVLFQYHREKQYKADKLDAQLQLFNTHLLDALEADTAPAAASRPPSSYNSTSPHPSVPSRI